MLPSPQSLRPWVASRAVAVVAPISPEAPRRVLSSGARLVFALEAEFPPETGIEVRPTARGIPLRDESVDAVLCERAYAEWPSERRSEFLAEIKRVLRADGVVVALVDATVGDPGAVAAELRAAFRRVFRLAPERGEGEEHDRIVMLASDALDGGDPQLVALAELEVDAPRREEVDAPELELEVVAEPEVAPDERVVSQTLKRELRPADVLIDRNRLREELARRTGELRRTEEQLWRRHEEVRKERLENVRLVAEVDRLREQVERTRLVERERAAELERQGRELRELEMELADLQGVLNTRDAQLLELEERLRRDRDEPDDVVELRARIRQLMEELERARARERNSRDLVTRRERELLEAGEVIQGLRRSVDEHANVAANVRSELDVVKIELEQSESKLPGLLEQLQQRSEALSEREAESAELQRNVERVTGEQQHLRHSLRLRRQEFEDLESTHLEQTRALEAAREELEALRAAKLELESALALRLEADGESGRVTEHSVALWPVDAVAEVQRLREQIADAASQQAEKLSRDQQRDRSTAAAERVRVRRYQLEATVRAEEQEYLLAQLERSEQRIWEMVDASDRSAARLAAGLAQLEKQREQHEDLVDELVVTRGLLRDERARVDELERLLATEQAKLARAGIAAEPVAERSRGHAADANVSAIERMIDTLGAEEDIPQLQERQESSGLMLAAVGEFAEAASSVGMEAPPVAELDTSFDLDAELQSILDGDPTGPALDFSALPVDDEEMDGLEKRAAPTLDEIIIDVLEDGET
ncbi:MAG: methyltransferase domain-containing protein [Myxococcales bacterium]|nr:methyltransferase domain-containing protein [Myxococcales bacterium]MCB9750146.1 methyltransferase domain-containing protein [Myxococcales bacterium]